MARRFLASLAPARPWRDSADLISARRFNSLQVGCDGGAQKVGKQQQTRCRRAQLC
jgi:hypothetical protein